MSETHQVFDPFEGKTVEISDRLVDRLRGRYAVGPTLPSGEPEFGWRQHDVPPIQKVAADTIEKYRNALCGEWPGADDPSYLRPINLLADFIKDLRNPEGLAAKIDEDPASYYDLLSDVEHMQWQLVALLKD